MTDNIQDRKPRTYKSASNIKTLPFDLLTTKEQSYDMAKQYFSIKLFGLDERMNFRGKLFYETNHARLNHDGVVFVQGSNGFEKVTV